MEQEQRLGGRLISTNQSNYDISEACKPWDKPRLNQAKKKHQELMEVVIWGGCVGNCAEHTLSRCIDGAAHSLRTITYCPDRTKGGVMVRPKYHLGDREGRQTFPSVESIGIRHQLGILPSDYGWDTPNLRSITLYIEEPGPEEELSYLSGYGTHQWIDTELNPKNLLIGSKKVVDITICSWRQTEEEGLQIRDLLEMHPPGTVVVPWHIHRLLLLPVLKPDQVR